MNVILFSNHCRSRKEEMQLKHLTSLRPCQWTTLIWRWVCVDVWSVAGLRRSDKPDVGDVRDAVCCDGAAAWRLLLQPDGPAGVRSILLETEPAHFVVLSLLLSHHNDSHVLLWLCFPREQTTPETSGLLRHRDAWWRQCSQHGEGRMAV